MKFYNMLRNARVTAFTVSELLSENQQRGLKLPHPPPHPPKVGLKVIKNTLPDKSANRESFKNNRKSLKG